MPSSSALSYSETAEFIVPLTTLSKEPLRDFDLEVAGKAASVLGRRENASVMTAAILSSLETGGVRIRKCVVDAVWSIVTGSPAEALSIRDDLVLQGAAGGVRVLDAARISEDARQLIDVACTNYVLVAVAPIALQGTRVLVKYSFHWDVETGGKGPSVWSRIRVAAGREGAPLFIDTSAPHEAASYHLEVHMPDDLRCGAVAMPLSEDANVFDERLMQVAHLNGSFRDGEGANAVMRVEVPNAGLRRVALLVSLFTGLFYLGDRLLPGGHEVLVRAGGGGSALLLAAPAAVLAMQARPGENALTSRFVQPLRWVIFGAAVLLFVGATSIVGHLRHPWVDLWWWSGAAVASATAIYLIWGTVVSARVQDVATKREERGDHVEDASK